MTPFSTRSRRPLYWYTLAASLGLIGGIVGTITDAGIETMVALLALIIGCIGIAYEVMKLSLPEPVRQVQPGPNPKWMSDAGLANAIMRQRIHVGQLLKAGPRTDEQLNTYHDALDKLDVMLDEEARRFKSNPPSALSPPR